jgi:hypothetical protein
MALCAVACAAAIPKVALAALSDDIDGVESVWAPVAVATPASGDARESVRDLAVVAAHEVDVAFDPGAAAGNSLSSVSLDKADIFDADAA